MNSKKILVAGATGYLGRYIAQVLQEKGYDTTIIVRNTERLKQKQIFANSIIQAELTDPKSIIGCCEGIDVVISTVGITKQKEGFSYMDVDYQANANLLHEAQKSKVSKFIYISVLNGDKLTNLKICEAKERFVKALKNSELDYCIVRPNGFFSDLGEVFEMAKNGRAYIFGDGNLKINPIHGYDLATFCVEMIENQIQETEVGGPQILTQRQIAEIAFEVQHKPQKITYIPDWFRKFLISTARLFLSSKTFGPIEFFMTTLSMEMIAPQYGKRTLKGFFEELNLKK